MSSTDRLDSGKEALSRCIKALLLRNTLTHSELKAFHNLVSPDCTTWLSTSQISGIRTGTYKAPGPRVLDSLGQINLRLAQLAGHQSPEVRELGPCPPLGDSLARLKESPWFLTHPSSGLPMTAGDLFMVWVGRIKPDLPTVSYSDRQARSICERLALEAQGGLMERGILPSKARPAIEAEYAAEFSQRQRDAVWATLMGATSLTGEQLIDLRPALSAAFGSLRVGRPLSDAEFDRWAQSGSLPV